MKRVICISNISKTSRKDFPHWLTINKPYEVYSDENGIMGGSYLIRNDAGHRAFYEKYLFISEKEFRKRKLEKIENVKD